jgi:hypothetical protein
MKIKEKKIPNSNIMEDDVLLSLINKKNLFKRKWDLNPIIDDIFQLIHQIISKKSRSD